MSIEILAIFQQYDNCIVFEDKQLDFLGMAS